MAGIAYRHTDELWENIMHTVGLKEAAGRLAKLIDEAASGEDVVITREDGTTSPKFGSVN